MRRSELLEQIYERGDALRSRRRSRLLGGGVAAVLVVGGMALAVDRGEEPRRVVTADSGTTSQPPVATTTSSPGTTVVTEPTRTTRPLPVEAPLVEVPLVEEPTPTTIPPETVPPTTPPLVCRNSVDPACGPFYYDWQVPNRPLIITITPSNPTPRVGEVVSFTILREDEDGSPISGMDTYTFDADALDPVTQEDLDTGDFGGVAIHGDGIPPGYGPWDPPPPLRSEFVMSTTYEGVGERRVVVTSTQTGLCGTQGDFECPTVTAEVPVIVVP